jgi:hypothetical protein
VNDFTAHSDAMEIPFANLGESSPLTAESAAPLKSGGRHVHTKLMITLSVVTVWGLSWEECGENPAIFCYRMLTTCSETLRASLCERRSEGGRLPI